MFRQFCFRCRLTELNYFSSIVKGFQNISFIFSLDLNVHT